MNASTSNLAIAAATFGDDVKAFRSSAVTAENKGNTAAKSLLAALVSGIYTESLAIAAIIHAFGNPKGKKGKVIETLSGLRNVTGGDGVRKMAETVFRIFKNIDADSVVVGEGDETVGGAIRPLIVAFILGEEGAPKSLRALNDAVNSALRAYAKATSPDNADAEADNEAEADTAPAAQSLTDRVLAVMVAYEAATADERVAAHDALTALWEMVNADVMANDDVQQAA